MGATMPDWLKTSLSGTEVQVGPLAFRIGVALLLGAAVAGIYRWARRGEVVAPTFSVTLILLAGLIAMATQIIGDNVARAFSLVGALSVVRFRTVVRDTQDTAFVIFAVVVGMASGAGNLAVGLIGLALIAASAPLLWRSRSDGWEVSDTHVGLRIIPGDDPTATIERLLADHADRIDLKSAATAKKGEALDVTYRIRLRPGASPTALMLSLSRLEGILEADLRRVE